MSTPEPLRLQFALLAVLVVCTFSCSRNDGQTTEVGTGTAITDAQLFAMTAIESSWTHYKRSPVPIARVSSPHPESRALVRYNGRASTQLDAQGKVRAAASFPDSSVIVKELFNGTSLETIAVMMKRAGSSSAGPGGWVWAEYGPTGSVKFSTQARGSACTGCHVAGIDFTRMNDSHP